jgi:hypothetical protein
MSLTATPDVPQNFPEKPASSSRVIKPVVTVAHFVQNLGCAWIATKACPTYFLVMAKKLVLVWTVANFLACHCSTTNPSSFL